MQSARAARHFDVLGSEMRPRVLYSRSSLLRGKSKRNIGPRSRYRPKFRSHCSLQTYPLVKLWSINGMKDFSMSDVLEAISKIVGSWDRSIDSFWSCFTNPIQRSGSPLLLMKFRSFFVALAWFLLNDER